MFRSFFNISLISDKKYILNNVSNSVDIKHKNCQNLLFLIEILARLTQYT